MPQEENKVELVVHKGLNHANILISHDQDLLFVNGTHVGYLNHAPGSNIMSITTAINSDTWQEIAAQCAIIRSHEVHVPIPYYVPPEYEENDE
jgi:hypothetical protein